MTKKQLFDTYYQVAHEKWFMEKYPAAYKDGFYLEPKHLDVKKANGLTSYICNFLTWKGHRATRINVSGRLVDGVEKQPSGAKVGVKKWIPSSTKKGTADISATINGRSVMIEIKVGRDKPRPDQLAEQIRERNAGGIYEFISTPEQFFELYDFIVNS
jgi:hypothetical protein